MRVAIAIVLFLVCGFEVSSQQYHFSIRNYKAVDGLPQSQVWAMIEDHNGYLWIGTEGGGLARFDGHSFRVYTTLDGLQSNVVSNLNIDSRGNLWIMHPRGITKFNGSVFKRFVQPGDPQNHVRLRRIFESGDSLLFMSAPGYIGKIFNDSVYYWSRPFFPGQKDGDASLISFVREGPDNELLFCIDFQKIYGRRGTTTFEIELGERYSYLETSFFYDGKLWLTTDVGLRVIDVPKRQVLKGELPIRNTILSYDSAMDVFWTYRGNNFFKEKIVNGKVKTDTVFADIEITNVLSDSEGNTWFGSNGSGLFKYFVQDFDRRGSKTMTNVMAIFHDSQKATWVGTTTKGVFRIHKGKTKSFFSSDEPRQNAVFSVTESNDGIVYLSSAYGLGKYEQSTGKLTWERFPAGDRHFTVWNTTITPSGAMWLSVPNGGLIRRDSTGTRRYTTEDGLQTNIIMAMHYSTYYDRLFVGDELGLASIQNKKVTLLECGLKNAAVIALTGFRDSLLVLSTGGEGVIIHNPRSGVSRVITTSDGLASDFVYFTAPDEEGNLWVGTEKGITKIRVNAALSVTEHLHYDYENGLTGVETNQNAFCFFEDNKLFGLVDGLYQFNDPPKRNRAFGLHLTDVQVFYGETDAHRYANNTGGLFNIPQGLSLPPDQNHITFKFNRVDKRARKSMKFKYLLQGFDKTWSKPSSSAEVTYGNLPPGDYSFLVMSTDSKGGWSGKPLQYDFQIQTPFYARTWFLIGMIVLAAFLTALIFYLRVRQRLNRVVMLEKIRIKEQESVRKDIARDFHDEMGNQLSRIINYVSLLKMNGHNGTNNRQDLYTKVEESAKYLYTGTRDFIWSIDPGNDDLSKLFIHIRDFGDKLFEEKNIKFRAVNTVRENIRLPYGFSREANLIFKEAMTNAFKYSDAANVMLSLKQIDEGFELCLEDDGSGFEVPSKDDRDGGLKNIRERADRISVRLGIESQPSRGTRVFIQFSKSKTLQYGLTF